MNIFMQIIVVQIFIMTFFFFTNCDYKNVHDHSFEICKLWNCINPQDDPNATPMVKRVARRTFILFNLEHALHWSFILFLLLGVLLSHITHDDNFDEKIELILWKIKSHSMTLHATRIELNISSIEFKLNWF
jgi:hypothetical protein